MHPEISKDPSRIIHGGCIRDAPCMLEKGTAAYHDKLPPRMLIEVHGREVCGGRTGYS
jgi:hypothetical protein